MSRVLKFERFYELFGNLKPGDAVLDYGSGDRPLEALLSSKFKRYIAADHPDANLKHAQRPHVYVTDKGIELESNSVDCVVMTEVLEHVYEPRNVLVEILRVLKPGGTLIGSVPFAMNEHEAPYDFHRYTYYCLERMFSEAGYRIKTLEYVGDMTGVAAVVVSKVLDVFNIVLRKMRLGFLAVLLSFVTRLPEFIYYFLVKIGANPQRLKYFKQFPVGFVFCVTKESDKAD